MNHRLHELLKVYLSGQLTEDQRGELAELLENEEVAEQLAVLVQAQLSEGVFSIEEDLPGTEDRIVQGVLRRLHPAPVRRMTFFRRWGWVAAVILVAAAGVYVWVGNKNRNEQSSVAREEIVPGSNKAVLTLSDGTTIMLDSVAGGTIAQQGNTVIVKLPGGGIVYDAKSSQRDETMMNTMRTPRGGEYHLTLPDGTQVWLNAASSITYPAAFTKEVRNVKISGEAYFEVAKDARRPFMVDVEGSSPVEVLGTYFNVNSYPGEDGVRTTLLEGSVRIGHAVLKPGQQARVSGQQLSVASDVNTDKVIAWKNGLFNFEDAGLREVMRQLERWYDIEVIYEKNVPDIRFEGEISRNINLSNLLKVLARADVKFRLEEGRRLVVLP